MIIRGGNLQSTLCRRCFKILELTLHIVSRTGCKKITLTSFLQAIIFSCTMSNNKKEDFIVLVVNYMEKSIFLLLAIAALALVYFCDQMMSKM